MWTGGKDGEQGSRVGESGEYWLQGLKSWLACEVQCRAFCLPGDKTLLNVVGAIGEKLKLSNSFPLQVIKTKFEFFLVLRESPINLCATGNFNRLLLQGELGCCI